MTEQEQFKEMILKSCDIKEDPNCEECLFSTVCDVKEICEKLHNAGYRKASEVIDEFVEKIKKAMQQFISYDYLLKNHYYNADCETIDNLIDKVAAEIRQEVKNGK